MKQETASYLGWLAIGMFGYGVAKSFFWRHTVSGPDCPLCAADYLTDPRWALHFVVMGPAIEEVQFRHALPQALGKDASAMLFGALHASPHLSAAGNAVRVLEAGLAGGVIYERAYELGGVPGATLVHAAHNLGAGLGALITARRQAQREGWRRVLVPAGPAQAALVCERGRSAWTGS